MLVARAIAPAADRPPRPPGAHGATPAGQARWVLIAAGDPDAARAQLGRWGVQPSTTLTKRDLLTPPREWRGRLRAERPDVTAVHSESWRRQSNPQLYELALALAPASERCVVDGETGAVRRIGRAAATLNAARVPLDCGAALGRSGVEVARFLRHRRSSSGTAAGGENAHDAVLAVWRGTLDARVGGSVTHMSGILGGFKRLGMRVGVITAVPAPEQLREVADAVVEVEPLDRAARVTRGAEWLLLNDRMRSTGRGFLREFGASLVYQRHDAMLTAGSWLAHDARLPLVLEWNSSEAWTRRNWEARPLHARALDALVAEMERHVARTATLTVAVSAAAAEMARAAGAPPELVTVVPNGVAFDDVPAPPIEDRRDRGAVLGWVGSFGPWHGAEIAIRALAELPLDVRLVMIGDGPGRDECQALARDLALGERVEWTGPLPHRRALRRLAGCDVLVSPHVPLRGQRFFGSPTKIFEYMAVGRPIVASRLGQIGEVLEDGWTARLVEPGDVADLAAAVGQVLAMPDRGQSLGRAARRQADRHHRWEQRAEAILSALPVTGRSRRREAGEGP